MVPAGLVVLIMLAGLALASSAKGGEVHFDPEGPAAKEYALPLQEARGEALGTSGPEGGDSSAATAPLFGVGVGGGAPPGDGDGNVSKAGITAGRGGGSREGMPGEASPGISQSTARGGQERAGVTANLTAPRAGFSLGLCILILLGLLLLGAVLGFGLRGLSERLHSQAPVADR